MKNDKEQKETKQLVVNHIESLIYTVRDCQVMIDRDLASLYGVETRALNQAVKRNISRFPDDFMFQLTQDEVSDLKSHFVISSWGGDRNKPYAFTEQGVAMLSSVLRSPTAVEINIQIMRAFVSMRKFLRENALVLNRLDRIEKRQIESESKIEELFARMEKSDEPKQGVFFQGEIFDAYILFEKLMREAKQEIVLIDNYIDITVLERLTKKKKEVKVKLYTSNKTNISNADVTAFNAQYPSLELNFTKTMHDRFLIIDGTDLYHIGASLKDLGKKCFAFQKMENPQMFIAEILRNL